MNNIALVNTFVQYGLGQQDVSGTDVYSGVTYREALVTRYFFSTYFSEFAASLGKLFYVYLHQKMVQIMRW